MAPSSQIERMRVSLFDRRVRRSRHEPASSPRLCVFHTPWEQWRSEVAHRGVKIGVVPQPTGEMSLSISHSKILGGCSYCYTTGGNSGSNLTLLLRAPSLQ